MEVAARKEGHVDFGSLDFVEPFEQMLSDLTHQARLSGVGHLVTPYYFTKILRMRLRVQRAAQTDTMCAIQRPVFILGLPRTGSTILHELLSLHPVLRAPTFWESHYWPEGGWRDQLTQGLTHAQLFAVDRLAPTFRRIHELQTMGPHECVSIQGYAFRSMQFHAAYRLPDYNRWMTSGCDWRPAYQWHARHLGLLQQDRQRWVLKAPGHMLGLAALLETYPDALFIQTHRHPTAVIPSMASLTRSLRGITTNHHDPEEIGRDVNALWWKGIHNVMTMRKNDPALNDRFLDLNFAALMAEPLKCLSRIIEHTGLDQNLSEPYLNRAHQYIQQRPQHRHGKHAYNVDQFGLSNQALCDQYADYIQHFDLCSDSTQD